MLNQAQFARLALRDILLVPVLLALAFVLIGLTGGCAAGYSANAVAQYNLGIKHVEGKEIPQNHAEAAKHFLVAAEDGHTEAQLLLGMMHASGKGVSQDYAEAEKWYRRAAGQRGFAKNMKGVVKYLRSTPMDMEKRSEIQFFLGVMYESRGDVPDTEPLPSDDWGTWFNYFSSSMAEGGITGGGSAWHKRVERTADRNRRERARHAAGLGGITNYTEAIRWYRCAAQQGHSKAPFNLGLIYSDNKSALLQDHTEAYAWFSIAAENGNKNAAELRDATAELLSPVKLSLAKLRIARYNTEVRSGTCN